MTAKVNPLKRFVRWCWHDVRSGETLDLWILVFASVIFTALGTTGIADVQTLSSVVLALLALLALSQLRGRQEMRSLVSTWKRTRTSLFESEFPSKYYEARARASHSYRFSGMSMARTLPVVKADLIRVLGNNGSVRILLPDPANSELMAMVAASRRFDETAEGAAASIRQTVEEAKRLGGMGVGSVDVRLTSLLPRLSMNVIDAEQPNALVMVQMYQIAPIAEPGPIFVLTPADEPWFAHFLGEFDRLWAHAKQCGFAADESFH